MVGWAALCGGGGGSAFILAAKKQSNGQILTNEHKTSYTLGYIS